MASVQSVSSPPSRWSILTGSATPQADDYWEISRRPWASLLITLPFLLAYEIGVLFLPAAETARNGADVWIRHHLTSLGFAFELLFPLLVPVILLIWHVQRRDTWKIRRGTIIGMVAESLVYTMVLIAVGQLFQRVVNLDVSQNSFLTLISQSISYLGAGIYEETLFRLMLLPLLYSLLRMLFWPPVAATVGSVVTGSFLFATAHYMDVLSFFDPHEIYATFEKILSESIYWYSFLFRFVGGMFFSVLFWMRGFGIAAVSHLFYDLIVGIVISNLGA